MTTVTSASEHPKIKPPPPPPPPEIKKAEATKVEAPAKEAEAKAQLKTAAVERAVDMRGVPPPMTAGARDQGQQVRDRLVAAGVKMTPNGKPGGPPKVADPAAPFTGSGATGIDVKKGTIPLLDQGAMAANRVAEKAVPAEELVKARDWAFEQSIVAESAGNEVATSIETNSSEIAKRLKAVPGLELPGRALELGGQGVGALTRGAGWLAAKGLLTAEGGLDAAAQKAFDLKYDTGAETTAKYSNPLENSNDYLASLSPAERTAQATKLLQQPINTLYPAAYGNNRPTRAQVVESAANKHNLDPNVLSGFLLAEQRDQSRNEDMKDYAAARNPLFKANTSIGLGQMTVATALANNGEMFADTLDASTRSRLTHGQAAKLLTSDEHAIFASARYIRKVADAGAALPAAKLPNTFATYPQLHANDLSKATWNDDQIKALGSEYTSRPWDDDLVEDWGTLVLESTRDVRRSGAFR